MPEPMPPFTGNGIFLSGGDPVMPNNAIAARLRAGNFGPFPNSTAPPGYVLPPTMDPGKIATALRSSILPNIAGGQPPAPKPAAPPPMQGPMLPMSPMGPGGPMMGLGFGPGGDIGVGYGGPGMGWGQGGWGDLGFAGGIAGIAGGPGGEY